MTIDLRRKCFELTKSSFQFLQQCGFEEVESYCSSGVSFKDGFHIVFRGPIDFRVEYYDAEFIPTFQKGQLKVDYLFIDREIFNGRSGYSGLMFMVDKLEAAVREISADIEKGYSSVLQGDDGTWKKIEKLRNAPKETRRLP